MFGIHHFTLFLLAGLLRNLTPGAAINICMAWMAARNRAGEPLELRTP